MFGRILGVSCGFLNLGHCYVERGILFEQVIGFLLQQCHGNWDHPCNIGGSFSGDLVFQTSVVGNVDYVYVFLLSMLSVFSLNFLNVEINA